MSAVTLIEQGDALSILRTLDTGSFNCCVTSPPYWGLRDYKLPPSIWDDPGNCTHQWQEEIIHTEIGKGNWTQAINGRGEVQGAISAFREPIRSQSMRGFCGTCGAWLGCLGFEPTPELFIKHIVTVFREVWRVLRDDGTLWLNIADSYNAGGRRTNGTREGFKQGTNRASSTGHDAIRPTAPNLKRKDLIGIPWMLAFALRIDGWYLRQDIIWHKPNPMPESVNDRCTKAHEYLFLLSKNESYYFDHDAMREPAIKGAAGSQFHTGKTGEHQLGRASLKSRTAGNKNHKYVTEYESSPTEEHRTKAGLMKIANTPWEIRNRRSVWTVAAKPLKEAHFATFPPALIEPCILAGCPVDGWVLDPFSGAGTTCLVAQTHNRNSLGIDLNPEYVKIAERRIKQ